MSIVGNTVLWTQQIFTPLGSLGLFILAFIESSFFPVPPDILLIILALAEPSKALWFAFVCTLGSVFGALLGYYIGAYGQKTLLRKLMNGRKIRKVKRLFNKYGGWAVFVAGFTPIPYKVFTISSGIFKINLRTFIIASIFSRGLRFFIVAFLIMTFGKMIIEFIDGYFNLLSVFFVIVLIVVYFIYRRVRKRNLLTRI